MNIIPIKASRILEELFPDGQKSYETNESQQHWTNCSWFSDKPLDPFLPILLAARSIVTEGPQWSLSLKIVLSQEELSYLSYSSSPGRATCIHTPVYSGSNILTPFVSTEDSSERYPGYTAAHRVSRASLVAQTFNPWIGKIFWKRKWQPTPVLLPGKFHGLRSLVGYSPWGHKESNTTERVHFLFTYRISWYLMGNLCYCSVSPHAQFCFSHSLPSVIPRSAAQMCTHISVL